MVILQTLAFRPVLRATSADKDESHAVLRRLSKVHSLVVATVLTLDILASLQSWVLDALWVDLQVFSSHRVVSTVDAVVGLTMLSSALIIVAELALEEEEATFITTVLFGIQHVVTL